MGIMARPRGNEWLADEIADLKKQKADILVSLLESREISELGLLQEEFLCNSTGIEFLHYPIPDRSIPTSMYSATRLILQLSDELSKGKNIVIHCRMGIGRSSIIAGALIQKEGKNTEQVIELISRIRTLKVPDTAEQIAWLKSLHTRQRNLPSKKTGL